MHLPACFGTSLAQCIEEALAIHVIQKNRLPPVAAIHDVVNRTRIFDSQLARHTE